MPSRAPDQRAVPIAGTRSRPLQSWKEIAVYLGVSVRTVVRWEQSEGLPVHRHVHTSAKTVYADASEIDAWLAGRKQKPEPERRSWTLRKAAPWCAVGLILAAALAYAIDIWLAPAGVIVPERGARPFATALPTQMWPAWSPDGKRLAFVTQLRGRRQLMLQALDSSTPVPLTGPDFTLQNNRQPFWSPDSQWVYFLTDRPGRGVGDLYRVPAAGGAPVPVQPGRIVRASLSPDGRTLVFLADLGSPSGLNVWFASPPESSPRPYEPRPFPTGAILNFPQLAFAPNGRKIVAALRIVPSLVTQYRLLPWPPGKARSLFGNSWTLASAEPVYLAWMPDSRHVLAASGQLRILDTESETVWPIAGAEANRRFAAVSPDGSRIAYQLSLSQADVVAVPLDGTTVRTILGSSSQEHMAACSPLADEFVYVTNKRGAGEVWLASLAGKWDRPLVTRAELASNGVESPVFSPDGRRVAFVAETGRTISIYVTAVGGGSPVLASGGAAVALSPSWSPDGDWLAYYTGPLAVDGRLVKARVGSSDPPVELGQGGMINAPVPEWSPTGEWIAFRDLDSRLALVSPDGKRRVRLAGDGPVAWTRNGKTLYQIRGAEGTLVAIDIPGGKERTLRTGLDPPYAYGNPELRISLTADGKSIVYTTLKAREEIWLLEGIRAPRPWYALFGQARSPW